MITPRLLNKALAEALGYSTRKKWESDTEAIWLKNSWMSWNPAENWALAGDLVDAYQITVAPHKLGLWKACRNDSEGTFFTSVYHTPTGAIVRLLADSLNSK